MTNVTYNMAYAEVLEILKYLPESELRKIPQDEIKFLENNMDKNYKFAIDPEKALEEQNISRKANAILVVYFKKYFTNDVQKQKLNEILTRNQQIVENEARKKYNPEDIFRKNNNQNLKNVNGERATFQDTKENNENQENNNQTIDNNQNVKNQQKLDEKKETGNKQLAPYKKSIFIRIIEKIKHFFKK